MNKKKFTEMIRYSAGSFIRCADSPERIMRIQTPYRAIALMEVVNSCEYAGFDRDRNLTVELNSIIDRAAAIAQKTFMHIDSVKPFPALDEVVDSATGIIKNCDRICDCCGIIWADIESKMNLVPEEI